MEFYEKLRELRKSRGLTQEELAEALYVSRTAVSKWESGRGYPSIDSLKEIAGFFSVTIDELLTGDKLIAIAEKENSANIRRMCNLLFGIVDALFFLLIILPLYPSTVEGHIYSVNLLSYTETTVWIRRVYWILYLAFMVLGAVKLLLTQLRVEKGQTVITGCSMALGIVAVICLALTRQAYALVVVFLFWVVKGMMLVKGGKKMGDLQK